MRRRVSFSRVTVIVPTDDDAPREFTPGMGWKLRCVLQSEMQSKMQSMDEDKPRRTR